VSNGFFNHYSLLKTVEDIFGIDEHLGYAGQQGLAGFFGCVSSDIAIEARDDWRSQQNGASSCGAR
jgi:hypothetical protein